MSSSGLAQDANSTNERVSEVLAPQNETDFDPSLEYSYPDMILFWKTPSVFCQWTPSTFTVAGISYVGCEQFFAAEKARLFGDANVLQDIMRVSDPRLHKGYGRAVSGFDQTIWERERENIVLVGNYAKFSQNPAMRHHLLGSGDKLLVEASPYDQVWGVGLQANDPAIRDQSSWRGLNLLGKALQTVRHALRFRLPRFASETASAAGSSE